MRCILHLFKIVQFLLGETKEAYIALYMSMPIKAHPCILTNQHLHALLPEHIACTF